MVRIKNLVEVERKLFEVVKSKLVKAGKKTVDDIIVNELPNKHSSSIADDLIVEETKNGFRVITKSPVWIWLNEGTGIYNPAHAGQGPGGSIVPLKAKALHFKNSKIASALGFPDENVFLKKVKGIHPRYFVDRYFDSSVFIDTLSRV